MSSNILLERLTRSGINVYLIGELTRNRYEQYMAFIDPVKDDKFKCFSVNSFYPLGVKVKYTLIDINLVINGISNGMFDCQRVLRSVVYINERYKEQLDKLIKIARSPVWIKRMFVTTARKFCKAPKDMIDDYLTMSQCYPELLFLKMILSDIKLDEEYNIDHIEYPTKAILDRDKIRLLFFEVELLMNTFPDKYKSRLIPSREGRPGSNLRKYYHQKMKLIIDEIKLINQKTD